MLEIKPDLTKKIKYIADNFEKWSVKQSVGPKQYIWFVTYEEPDLSYEFNDSRMGVSNDGRFVWEGTSGCSCPIPWEDGVLDGEYYPIGKTIQFDQDSQWGHYLADDWYEQLSGAVERMYLALKSPKKLTAQQVLQEDNSELRRVLIEKMGMERFVAGANAQLLDEDPRVGRLLKIPLKDDENIVLLEVQDASTDRMYLLRVPPTTKTALAAKAWTFGMKPEDFAPAVET